MKSYTKIMIPIVIVFASLINANFSLAGTTQIFSPSGLPRSSTQDYSIPETTVAPQTFPTPPIPVGDTGLQSFSNIPLKEELTAGSSKPSPSSVNGLNNTPNSEITAGSVESFFQCNPSLVSNELPKNKNYSGSFNVSKLLWHTLDNIGVPLSTSKESALDPSLNNIPTIQTKHPPNETSKKPIYQKIPDSELGVTDIIEKDDTKLH